MTLVDLDTGGAAVLSWLLTYAIHSTILVCAALAIASRFADEHAWLDRIWKTALLGPLVTASVQIGAGATPLGGRWPIAMMAPVAMSSAVPPATQSTAPSTRQIERAPTPLQTVEVQAPQTSSSPVKHVQPVQPVQPASPSAASPAAPRGVRPGWPAIAVVAWLAIGAMRLLWFGARLLRLHRTLGWGHS